LDFDVYGLLESQDFALQNEKLMFVTLEEASVDSNQCFKLFQKLFGDQSCAYVLEEFQVKLILVLSENLDIPFAFALEAAERSVQLH